MIAEGRFETGLGVRCRQLRHVYTLDGTETVALDSVELSARAGESVGILGASGSGKSTLVTLLAGLQRPTSGSLYLGADDVAQMTERELLQLRGQRVGVVMQNPSRNLLPYGTGLDNIAFAQQSAHGYRRNQLPPPADLLAELGLADLARQRVHRMSGGEQQRLAVAVGVCAAPGLLVADEPTSQLDRESRDRVVDLLRRVGRVFGTTIIVVTHDVDVAAGMSRTVTIREGRASDAGQTLSQWTRVAADGSVPLPADLSVTLPPGTPVRIVRKANGVELLRADDSADGS